MHKKLLLGGLILTAVVADATPGRRSDRRTCDEFMKDLFGHGPSAARETLAARLNLTASATLEIFRDDFRRCPDCIAMNHSTGILERIPVNQFYDILLHDLPEFSQTKSSELRSQFERILRAVEPGGRLILTLPRPVDWAIFNAQLKVGRELGLEIESLRLADFDLAGAAFRKMR